MNNKELRKERLGLHMVKAFKRRNMEAFYCRTAAEAADMVSSLIPDGSTVTWGGSATIRDMGLPVLLADRDLNVLDRDKAETPEAAQQIYRQAFSADYYLSSANAVSEDGVIVNIDGNGNRVAAISFGPKHVIFVIGLNKVAPDVDAAVKRARSTASPINAARFDLPTPCQKDGVCHNCTSPDSVCCFVHIVRNSRQHDRIKVVVVGDDMGY